MKYQTSSLKEFYSIYLGTDKLEVSSPLGDVKVAIPKSLEKDRAAVEALIELGARIQMVRLRRAKQEVKEIMSFGKETGVR